MIIFWIKEAFKSIGRAKSSFILSLISISISVILITASLLSVELSQKLQSRLTENITVNVFLLDSISEDQITSLKHNISQKEFTASLEFISKEKAADIFVRETGEDFRKILDYNPLPASFTVNIKENFVENKSLENIKKVLSQLNGVEEVVYKSSFVNTLLSYIEKFKKYIFIFTVVLLFISIYIVYSTSKLVISSKLNEFETMKLVGAKLSTIKMPVILNGVIIGIFAGIISASIFLLYVYYIDNYIGILKFLSINKKLYLLILVSIGPVLGFLVSTFSLRKVTLKV